MPSPKQKSQALAVVQLPATKKTSHKPPSVVVEPVVVVATSQPKSKPKRAKSARVDERNLVSSMNSVTTADSTLNLAVQLSHDGLFHFIHDSLCAVWRAKPTNAVYTDACNVADWMATNVVNMPLDGMWPRWYLDLCYSARAKDVGGQSYVFSVAASAAAFSSYITGLRTFPDSTTAYDLTSKPVALPVKAASSYALAQSFLVANAREIHLVDAREYRPRHKDCVSIAAFFFYSETTPQNQHQAVALEVPIRNKWIAALCVGGVNVAGRAPRFVLRTVPVSRGTISYLVRENKTKYIDSVYIKTYDPKPLIQHCLTAFELDGNKTATQMASSIKVLTGAIMARLQPYLGIGGGMTFNMWNNTTAVANNTSMAMFVPDYIGTAFLPEAVAAKLSNCCPRISDNKLYLPVFTDLAQNLYFSQGQIQFKYSLAPASPAVTYNLWPDTPFSGELFANATSLVNFSKTVFVTAIRFDPAQSTIHMTEFYRPANANDSRLFSREKIKDIDQVRVFKWLPLICADNALVGTLYDEPNCYPIGRSIEDYSSLNRRFVNLTETLQPTAVPNLPKPAFTPTIDVSEKVVKAKKKKTVPYSFLSQMVYNLVPRHGNYGGPNYTGGVSGGNDYSIEPLDKWDEAYREHDLDVHLADTDEEVTAAHARLYENLARINGDSDSVDLYHMVAKPIFAALSRPPPGPKEEL